ncbi:MAG: phasin family protein [Acidobacteriota bacterium]|nr:phasin family protein [Acidobacteriota bacterium]
MKNIKEMGTDVYDFSHKFYLAGLGIAATVNDSGKKVFDQLVEKGSGTSEKMPKPKVMDNTLVNRLSDLGKQTTEKIQDRVASTISRFGIPSRDEIQALTRSVEQLTEKVQNLQTKATA